MSFDNKKHWIATGRNDKSQISHHIREEQSDVEIDLTPQRQKLIGQRLGDPTTVWGFFNHCAKTISQVITDKTIIWGFLWSWNSGAGYIR
jgi:hypothetical protein